MSVARNPAGAATGHVLGVDRENEVLPRLGLIGPEPVQPGQALRIGKEDAKRGEPVAEHRGIVPDVEPLPRGNGVVPGVDVTPLAISPPASRTAPATRWNSVSTTPSVPIVSAGVSESRHSGVAETGASLHASPARASQAMARIIG
jgi:hypothetical protein